MNIYVDIFIISRHLYGVGCRNISSWRNDVFLRSPCAYLRRKRPGHHKQRHWSGYLASTPSGSSLAMMNKHSIVSMHILFPTWRYSKEKHRSVSIKVCFINSEWCYHAYAHKARGVSSYYFYMSLTRFYSGNIVPHMLQTATLHPILNNPKCEIPW